MSTTAEQTLDVRPIPPREKHPTIFRTFDALEEGEHFVLVNDHDPSCMYYTLEAEEGKDRFAFECLDEGPEVWRVHVTKTEAQ